MCNFMHYNSIPLQRKRGKGYKIFQLRENNLYSMCGCPYLEKIDDNNIILDPRRTKIKWKLENWKNGGFCFFFSLKETKKLKKEWEKRFPCEKYVLYRIYYSNGICRHIEDKIVGGLNFNIGLTKEFIATEPILNL